MLPTRQGRSASKQIRPGGNDDEAAQQASRRDLARALAPRYAQTSRREKTQLLDEFCAITGYTRKHALVDALLRHRRHHVSVRCHPLVVGVGFQDR